MGAHEQTRGNGHILKHRSFPLNMRKHIFTLEGDQVVTQVVRGGCRVSVLGYIQELPDQGTGQLWVSLLEQGVWPM